jgi:hypothetical protein
MMALELPDTKWAGVIQPDPDSAQAGDVETEHILAPADGPRRTVMFRLRVYTATELARLLEDVGLPRSSALATSTGGSSRVRAGSLCEPESQSGNGPWPPTATASRWTCGLVRSTNPWKSDLSRCRFRHVAVTETSVHNAVQPVTHARGTCSGERSKNADHETTRRWLPSSVCRFASGRS